MSARKYGDEESRPIYLWNGILEPKHRERMGQAIWLFLYFIDRTTKERPNKIEPERIEGWVYGKMPLTLARMAEETGLPERTISRYLLTLEIHDYIRATRAPHGLIILLQNSCKRCAGQVRDKGSAKSGESRHARTGESPAIYGNSPAKSGECRKDESGDESKDKSKRGQITARSACVFTPSNEIPLEEPTTEPTAKPYMPPVKIIPREMTEADAKERQRLLSKQSEEMIRRFGTKGCRLGLGSQRQPQEVSA